MAEITCIGQALVDCITRGGSPERGRKRVYRADSISLSIGGDAINEATVLARLGHDVRLVCGLGDDLAGRLIYDSMKKLGVDLRYADIEAGRPTPIANLLVEHDGSRDSYNSDATMLGDYSPDHSVTADTRVVSFASLFRAPIDRIETVVPLVKEAKKNGAIICADTKLPTFRQMQIADLSEVLPLIDYMFPNDAEAAYFSGYSEIADMAAFFRNAGVKNVIIKAGEKGCYVSGRKDQFTMKALPVKAIDGTGAGDNYVAGFLSGLLRGFSLYECCQYGTVCAAACVQNAGAGGGVKSREEADRLMDFWYGS